MFTIKNDKLTALFQDQTVRTIDIIDEKLCNPIIICENVKQMKE